MPMYKLKRRFYDGEKLHPIDAVLSFVEGTQPKTAVLVKAKEKAPVAEDFEEVFTDDDGAMVEDAKPGDTLSSLAKKGK